MVAVRAEAALHTVDHIGHSHKEDRLQTVNQSVGNAASGIGFAGADIPKQEKPDFIALEPVPVLNILFRLGKLCGHHGDGIKPPERSGNIPERFCLEHRYFFSVLFFLLF